jgi:hypothetical protein
LQNLDLSSTQVTDVGLAYLRGLKDLQYPGLSNTFRLPQQPPAIASPPCPGSNTPAND